ncbi:cupin domain-containing protein [Pseudaminobacter sp. 19-2017]|uniref:Cupin domain-containing protein n=1 Tax=Pseudaminobacter soli (ex Zhang et al. 2022) TaxID=2831468 RepID=A0A942E0X5_9HYPH|nr:cupin domain-containing protein [Pseudaminobacter soli]MBS3650857.1 cupin domain-containing protein [Pseudaminobacter soli]
MMDWSAVEEQTPIPGFHGKVLHTDSMSFVLWRIDAGASLPEHRHVHEQVIHMLDGTFEATVDGRTETLHAGMVSAIPSNALHSGRALTDCRILDAFSPVREDYRHGLTSGVISGVSKG